MSENVDNFDKELDKQLLKIVRKKDLLAKIPLARKNLHGLSQMLLYLKQILEYSDNINKLDSINKYTIVIDDITKLIKYCEEEIERIRNKMIDIN